MAGIYVKMQAPRRRRRWSEPVHIREVMAEVYAALERRSEETRDNVREQPAEAGCSAVPAR